MSPEIATISRDPGSMHVRCCLAATAGQEGRAESPAAAEEIAWLQALHAVELCQQVAELAARR